MSLPSDAGERRRHCVPEIPSARHPLRSGCGEEQFKVVQSAGQLDVQKNVLLNGFDSSTENRALFKGIFQKS